MLCKIFCVEFLALTLSKKSLSTSRCGGIFVSVVCPESVIDCFSLQFAPAPATRRLENASFFFSVNNVE